MRYFLLICYAVIIACNNDSATATSKDSTSTATSVNAQTGTSATIITPSCYALQTSNNLVLLKLNTVRPTVSGHLTYAIMGKDKNEGTISGIMRGDTLLANYNFMSEGKQSVRQVAFLKKGDAFIEGYGDSEQKGDSMIFSKTDTLNFNGTMILEQVPCTHP
jgi:hypothetical protein